VFISWKNSILLIFCLTKALMTFWLSYNNSISAAVRFRSKMLIEFLPAHLDDYIQYGSNVMLSYAVWQVVVFLYVVLAVSGGTYEGDYLSLPYASHIRLIVFTCIVSLLVSIFVIGLHMTSTLSIFPINWQLFVSIF